MNPFCLAECLRHRLAGPMALPKCVATRLPRLSFCLALSEAEEEVNKTRSLVPLPVQLYTRLRKNRSVSPEEKLTCLYLSVKESANLQL